METALPLAIFVVIALIAFLLLSAKKFVDYSRWSKHSRFDLYPIPKEGAEKNKYGGSYYEENEWWEKGRYTSVSTEMMDLAPEMFFIRKMNFSAFFMPYCWRYFRKKCICLWCDTVYFCQAEFISQGKRLMINTCSSYDKYMFILLTAF